jgi:hypothetical protein
VALIGNLVEGGFEIAGDLINEGAAGAVLGAIQIALVMGHGVQAVDEWAQGGALRSDGE